MDEDLRAELIKWIAEDDAGRPNFTKWQAEGAAHPIEETGQKLRKHFSWKQQDADYVEGTAAR